MPNDTSTNNIETADYISDAPTLLIGLGGLGSYMTNTIYKELPSQQKDYVEAIIMDTDVEELKADMYDELRNTNSIIQTSPSEIVQDCVKRLGINESVAQWFPADLLGGALGYKQMPAGAAQVRPISRLSMLDTINSQRIDCLNKKLNKLLRRRGDTLEESCRIVIINSTAGGTGSGSFLQLALYIREYFNKLGITKITIRSFVVMPEIFVMNRDYSSQSLKDNVRANGYAVLKEIDAVFAIRAGNDNKTLHPIKLEYVPNKTTPETITAGVPPFDVVTLFDYADVKGSNIDYKVNYIDNALDVIRLHVFSPLIGRGGITSQTDNLLNHHIKSANRSNYSSSGAANIEYPVEDIIEYMALRWATDGISSNWLEIDKQIVDEIRRVEQLRKEGIIQEMPDCHKRFAELLREKCEIDRPTPFYRNIYNDAHLLDEHGDRVEVKHTLWLNALAKRLDSNVEQAISEKSKNLNLNIEALKDPDQVESQVTAYEKGLHRYKKELNKRVQNSGSAVAKESIWSPYQNKVDVSPQQEIQLNTWLLAKDKPLHPLAMRYFLCEAVQVLSSKVRSCKAKLHKLEKSLDNYIKIFDDPGSRVIEKAEDIARENAKLRNRIFGNLKRFAEDYEGKSKTHKKNIEEYAKYTVQLDCYETLLGYLNDLADTWKDWFNQLENIVNKNHEKIQKLEQKHDDTLNPTVEYVLASSRMKRVMWEDEKVHLANQDFPPDISKQIYLSVYQEKGKQYIDQLSPDKSIDWVTAMFSKHVIGWCRKELRQNPNINMNVSDAIKKELDIEKKQGIVPSNIQASYQLQSYMNKLNQLAVPLVNLENKGSGEDFEFICMHPNVVGAWNEQERHNIIGDKVFVNLGFSPYKMSKLAIKHGLLATDLKDIADKNGVYRTAYEERIRASRQVPRASTTPHLDDHWDSPAFLPEMDDELQALSISNIYRATLINEANNLAEDKKPVVFALEYDREDLWHWFPTKGKAVPITGLDRKSAKANLYNLVDVFAVNYHLVETIIEQESKWLTDTRNKPEDSSIITHALDLIKQIYHVEFQTENQQIGIQRQTDLLNNLLDSISTVLTARYAPNTAKAKLEPILDKLKEEVSSITSDTSEAYIEKVLVYIDNYSMD